VAISFIHFHKLMF